MTADEPILSLNNVNAYYGRAQILFDVCLNVQRGEVVVLLGRNGAGKTTTLKSIIQQMPHVSGQVKFNGHAIEKQSTHSICRLGLGYVPEDRRIFTDLTVLENLEVGRQPPRADMEPWTHERLFQMFPNLATMGNRRSAHMSGGEQQMLSIARTLMGNPIAVLLDEPSEGLAPLIVEYMAETIRTLKKQRLAVILCEQNLHFAMDVADRAYILEKGHIRYSGTIDDLAANESIRTAHLSV
ncbi:MAG: ABC transporter ATP-binding protein [Alphaproteobacteria bacterium]